MHMKQILKAFIILNSSFLVINCAKAQPLKPIKAFTNADTLRGTYGTSRDWWDVLKYDLHVKFNLSDSSISGWNAIQYKAVKFGKKMQIDLQEGLTIDSIVWYLPDGSRNYIVGNNLNHEGNAYFFPYSVNHLNIIETMHIYYHGKPRIAIRPPWDGGLILKKDEKNNPFVSLAC